MMKWTKELDSLLIAKRLEGMSSDAIAQSLGTTRSSIDTRLSRLKSFSQTWAVTRGITLASSSIAQTQHPTKGPNAQAHASCLNHPAKPADKENGIAPSPIAFIAVQTDQCRYPLWPNAGDPPIAQKMVCGAPTIAGTSWCPFCLDRVHAPASCDRARR
jgi:hypothetical protein